MDTHAYGRLHAWDPAAGDLDDETAIHIDSCPACRQVFDERFPPLAGPGHALAAAATRPLARPAEGSAPSWRGPRKVTALLAVALLAATALFSLAPPNPVAPPDQQAFSPAAAVPNPDSEKTWQTFLAASAAFDGARARAAVAEYLTMAPMGPHREHAESAATRLALVGERADLGDARWVQGSAPPGSDWMALLWQVWCRFCVPALRKLELLQPSFPIVALTSATRGTLDDDVAEATADLTMPVAITAGPASQALDVPAWPSVVLVCGGVVRWVGGPEELHESNMSAPCASGGQR